MEASPTPLCAIFQACGLGFHPDGSSLLRAPRDSVVVGEDRETEDGIPNTDIAIVKGTEKGYGQVHPSRLPPCLGLCFGELRTFNRRQTMQNFAE